MEKILNFNSRYKIQLTPNRHSTLPPNYYAGSETKEAENEGESPVFTRKNDDKLKKGDASESTLFSLTKVKQFDTDYSESEHTPESININVFYIFCLNIHAMFIVCFKRLSWGIFLKLFKISLIFQQLLIMTHLKYSF